MQKAYAANIIPAGLANWSDQLVLSQLRKFSNPNSGNDST